MLISKNIKQINNKEKDIFNDNIEIKKAEINKEEDIKVKDIEEEDEISDLSKEKVIEELLSKAVEDTEHECFLCKFNSIFK